MRVELMILGALLLCGTAAAQERGTVDSDQSEDMAECVVLAFGQCASVVDREKEKIDRPIYLFAESDLEFRALPVRFGPMQGLAFPIRWLGKIEAFAQFSCDGTNKVTRVEGVSPLMAMALNAVEEWGSYHVGMLHAEFGTYVLHVAYGKVHEMIPADDKARRLFCQHKEYPFPVGIEDAVKMIAPLLDG